MKYLVLLCDGMADTPVPELGRKTPMEAAQKPNMDALAREALVGTAKTVPDGMKPGSDVANLSALGYHPADCYTGRSPLEAASIGVDLAPDEYAIRCNLVTLSDEPAYADKSMADYCAGDISTAEATELIHFLAEHLPERVGLARAVDDEVYFQTAFPDFGGVVIDLPAGFLVASGVDHHGEAAAGRGCEKLRGSDCRHCCREEYFLECLHVWEGCFVCQKRISAPNVNLRLSVPSSRSV